MIITSAQKPAFYTRGSPFRVHSANEEFVKWSKVCEQGREMQGQLRSERDTLGTRRTHALSEQGRGRWAPLWDCTHPFGIAHTPLGLLTHLWGGGAARKPKAIALPADKDCPLPRPPARLPGHHIPSGCAFACVQPLGHQSSHRSFVSLLMRAWPQAGKRDVEQGRVLIGGSLEELARLTGWYGRRVLYVGDHLHADLREPRRIAGWSTVSRVGGSSCALMLAVCFACWVLAGCLQAACYPLIMAATPLPPGCDRARTRDGARGDEHGLLPLVTCAHHHCGSDAQARSAHGYSTQSRRGSNPTTTLATRCGRSAAFLLAAALCPLWLLL